MTKTSCNDNDPVRPYIRACCVEIERQADEQKGWPNPLLLPEPQNEAERHALRLWLAEVEQQTGVPMIRQAKR
jgi:hypothetical protein